MSNRGKVAALIGFVILGLSPSFMDYQQSPELRWQFWAYYAVALVLISFGLWDGG